MRKWWCIALLSGALNCAAQQGTAVQPSVAAQAALTPEQQAMFSAAKQNFAAHHPEVALDKMKALHAALPENRTITDATAETAITVGQDAYAIEVLRPWAAAHPEDYFALEWLARAYAETGAAAERDRAIAAVVKAHETTTDERFRRSDRFLAERVKLPDGALEIYTALVPFSPYHIYMLGRQVDAGNVLVRQITLESNDGDQIGFAKDHPEMVAKGMRRFSMDTYSAARPDANGTMRQTQALIGFMDGQPSYDETKARMMRVAAGEETPVETRSGLPVPAQK